MGIIRLENRKPLRGCEVSSFFARSDALKARWTSFQTVCLNRVPRANDLPYTPRYPLGESRGTREERVRRAIN